MSGDTSRWLAVSSVMCVLVLRPCSGVEQSRVAFTREPGRVAISIGGRPFATYVYKDEKIPRPYFAHVHAPNGIQVTRNHPPRPNDSQDHALLHPGMWLAFGDVSGHDYWRLKARVMGGEFVEPPKGGVGRGTFTVRNRYLTTDGKGQVCVETCRYTILARPAGYLLIADSVFKPCGKEFYFGDQEELGFGVRLATPIAVRSGKGGHILDSEGRRNEKGVWGKQADWCDYSGMIGGRPTGIMIMSDPKNVRRSWWHARDYGFLAGNPYGVNAFTKGPKSRIVVKKGEAHRLRYGVLIHGGPAGAKLDLKAAYADYLTLIRGRASDKSVP